MFLWESCLLVLALRVMSMCQIPDLYTPLWYILVFFLLLLLSNPSLGLHWFLKNEKHLICHEWPTCLWFIVSLIYETTVNSKYLSKEYELFSKSKTFYLYIQKEAKKNKSLEKYTFDNAYRWTPVFCHYQDYKTVLFQNFLCLIILYKNVICNDVAE